MIQVQPLHTQNQFHISLSNNTRSQHLSYSAFGRLAELSNQNQWVLFTAETPRPSASTLQSHAICCDRVIHMKPSSSQPEEIIVMKAIQSGNASAVVASGNIPLFSQAQLKSLARQYHCEVFFTAGEHDQLH
ncbi:hypothetical protein L4C33_13435 [Vibrio makurazakiensis]|uniref:hypothetical protein n=1 Tax=Vibrio makurazakiensis TaxID=2910250 RepID=UPI003D131C8F